MNTKSILITGARSFVALDLARTFFDAGMRVICVDSLRASICRYSKKVNSFYQIASPRFQFEEFVSDLQKIIKKENIDCIIPTCEEVFYLGKAKNQLETSLFCEKFEDLEILHNKWKFYHLLLDLGLNPPETHLWKGEKKEREKWIIKPVYSRFAAHIQVVEKTWPDWKECLSNPLILQRYIDGKKICSYSICHQGSLSAHSTYQVLHSMGIGSAICLQSIYSPEVEEFVKHFAKERNFTGQISFDFILSDKLYCIECNPRTTSGVHLFEKNPELAHAFFSKKEMLTPKIGMISHDHLFMLYFGIKQKEFMQKRFWKHFFQGKSPLWIKGDLRSICGLPMILFEIASKTLFKRQGFHQAMSEDMEYNGEPL